VLGEVINIFHGHRVVVRLPVLLHWVHGDFEVRRG
jgi:hypothetical protein